MKYVTKYFPISPPPKVEEIDKWLNSFKQFSIEGYVVVNNFIVITIQVVDSGA